MASTVANHRLHEFRDRLEIGLTASSLQGLNMTNEMRPKQDEDSVYMTPPRSSPYSPNSSPYSPNNGVVIYDIPVTFPELEQHPLQPPSPYLTSSGSPQEDAAAAYINYHGGSPPYSPPYDNSPSVNCGSPGSVGSLQLDMCSPPIPCTTSNQFSQFLPQPQTCTSMTYCDQEACINTIAYHSEPQNWMLSQFNIPAVHIEPSNDLPMGTIHDRQLSSSPDLTYYPPSPHYPSSPQSSCAGLPAMYLPNIYTESFPPMNLPYHAHAPANMPTPQKPRIPKRAKPQKPPIDVDDSEIKDIPSSAQLWEFTLRVLKKPKYNNMVCWENQKEGLFRFHDAQAFAALWGKHRNRPNMTYDKVARALRYYYKRNIFKQVGGRLTYRFSDRLRKLYHNED